MFMSSFRNHRAFFKDPLVYRRQAIVMYVEMCSQQLLEVGFKPGGKPQAILFVIDVFIKGKDRTGVKFRKSIGGDRSHDSAYRQGNIYLAEQPFLLTVSNDLGDLFQVT